jgi:hypothetical protein
MLEFKDIPAWFQPEATNCWSFPRCEPRWINRDVQGEWFDKYGLFPGQADRNSKLMTSAGGGRRRPR